MRLRFALLLASLVLAGCADDDEGNGGDGGDGGNGGDGGSTPTPGTPTRSTPTAPTSATPTQPTSPTVPTPSGGEDHEVILRDNTFQPASLSVSAGDRVEFRNDGSASHTVTIHKVGDPTTTLLLDETLAAGEDTGFTFTAAATHHVWCRFHGTMTTGMAMVVTAA